MIDVNLSTIMTSFAITFNKTCAGWCKKQTVDKTVRSILWSIF